MLLRMDIKCYQNLSENNSDETIILNCPFCHLDTLWSNNMDLIIILEEVHKNTTVHYLDEIAKINSSELSENYSKNFPKNQSYINAAPILTSSISFSIRIIFLI